MRRYITFVLLPPPPRSTLCPYTTLFRSALQLAGVRRTDRRLFPGASVDAGSYGRRRGPVAPRVLRRRWPILHHGGVLHVPGQPAAASTGPPSPRRVVGRVERRLSARVDTITRARPCLLQRARPLREHLARRAFSASASRRDPLGGTEIAFSILDCCCFFSFIEARAVERDSPSTSGLLAAPSILLRASPPGRRQIRRSETDFPAVQGLTPGCSTRDRSS